MTLTRFFTLIQTSKTYNFSLALFFLFSFFFFLKPIRAQYSSAEILQKIHRLNVLGSALYLAAHPDDENTTVLSYLSKHRHLRSGYLSLTRGGGGQNLIGTEKGALLGIIRTQELLSARKIDGAEQFFTRAVDFGYSKSAQETFKHWNYDEVLEDIVHVIREFKPDVIITRFSETQGGHGHHLASATLAKDAFKAAADGKRFEHQLQYLDTWQAKRLVWDSWRPSDNAVPIDIGQYNKVLGETTQQLSAASRSMHKSQGFGVSAAHGPRMATFEHTAGDSAHFDLLDGLDLTWNRVKKGHRIQRLVSKLEAEYDVNDPSKSTPLLLKIYRELRQMPGTYWVKQKLKETKELIRLCSGLWLESVVWKAGVEKGESVEIRSLLVNRSSTPVKLLNMHIDPVNADSSMDIRLENNLPVSIKKSVTIPLSTPYSQPYWLIKPQLEAAYQTPDNSLTGKAESPPSVSTRFTLDIMGERIAYSVPVRFKETDPVRGEVHRPFIIRPAVNLSTGNSITVFADDQPKTVVVAVETKTDSIAGMLSARAPEGWIVEPLNHEIRLNKTGEKVALTFNVRPHAKATAGRLQFELRSDNHIYTQNLVQLDYRHIKPQTVLLPTEIKLVKLDVEVLPRRIGYVMGSGDYIPDALGQLGYDLQLLTDAELESGSLSEFDVIICGIRAFNTRDALIRSQKRLVEYVAKGGTWIVQHNTRFGNRVGQIGPYPFSSEQRHRISEEDAPIDILLPEHRLMNYPNEITRQDFEGWVQERGLYFADSWEGKLYPLLAGSDQGEPARLGGLLYAPYGKGVFIYTGFSWFRQLPAGVPGAYRIFVNLISAERE